MTNYEEWKAVVVAPPTSILDFSFEGMTKPADGLRRWHDLLLLIAKVLKAHRRSPSMYLSRAVNRDAFLAKLREMDDTIPVEHANLLWQMSAGIEVAATSRELMLRHISCEANNEESDEEEESQSEEEDEEEESLCVDEETVVEQEEEPPKKKMKLEETL